MNSPAGDAGISHTTAKAWVSLLEASYVVFLLRPWFGNVSKRLIKSPKLYFFDVGLAAYLLGIQTAAQMSRDPLRGNLFENLVVTDALKYQYNRGERSSLHYYRDSRGHEVDLLVDAAGRLCPIEIKSGATVVKEFFSSIEKFSVMLGAKACYGGVVYGSVDGYQYKTYAVTPYSMVHRLMASICEGTAS